MIKIVVAAVVTALHASDIGCWKEARCGLVMPLGVSHLHQIWFSSSYLSPAKELTILCRALCWAYYFRPWERLGRTIAMLDQCLLQSIGKRPGNGPFPWIIQKNGRILGLCNKYTNSIYRISLSECWKVSVYRKIRHITVLSPQTIAYDVVITRSVFPKSSK